MIRKITLQNFMSHRHTVIEPASGLTVLVGDNNCGKSAVVAALQILCRNASGDYMVRHGENECKIIVETDEGHIVEWKRKGGTVSYTLNGKAIHRLRGGIPDDLHKLLRIPMVFPQDGGDPFDIHFGEQKKPIFLLDEPGSRAAKFFASSSDAEVLIRMQILHKKNVQNAIHSTFR
jgi:predicted ATPase